MPQRWETLDFSGSPEERNALGAQGWEAYAVTVVGIGERTWHFKRPLPDTKAVASAVSADSPSKASKKVPR